MSGSGFAEVLVRSDNEPAVLAQKESTVTALKLAGVKVKREESALQSNEFGRERCEGCERCRANESGLPCQALRTGVPRRTSSPALACEILCGDGEQLQERPRRQDSLRAAQRAQVRASTAAFCGQDPLHDESRKEWRESNQDGRTESSLVCLTGVDELHVGTERGMHKVRTVRRREATERVDLSDQRCASGAA